jgi:hypothetical protein
MNTVYGSKHIPGTPLFLHAPSVGRAHLARPCFPIQLFNPGAPGQATALSLHNHQPLSRGTVAFGLPLNDVTPNRAPGQNRYVA